MVGAFCDMTEAEVKCGEEAAEAHKRAWLVFSLSDVELIERLVLVAGLRCDLNIFIGGDECVNEVHRDRRLMAIFENEAADCTTNGQIGAKSNVNFSDTLHYFIDGWELC